MVENANSLKAVDLLVKLAGLDTVYRDVHLKRARELLSATLDESAYRAIGSSEKELNELTARSRSAVFQRDWHQAADISARVAMLREHVAATRNLGKIGVEVYDAAPVAFEPFSPGKHLGASARANQAVVRAEALAALASLAKLDATAGTFYEQRRHYFSALEVTSAASAAEKGPQSRSRAQVERMAMEAAERGDAGALERLAKELRDWKETGLAAVASTAPARLDRYECPLDLATPFPPRAVEAARRLGLVEAHATPMAEFAKVREVIYTHIDQPTSASSEMEREGVLRARAQAESHLPTDLATEEARVLASQFLEQIFLNSGGARYVPSLGSDTALLEDFAENESTEASSELLAALGLRKRSGRSRTEIEVALMDHGADVLKNNLGLDPIEFRLVCIPYDLYTRFGRERGWGKWPHWTHFDGYQVMGGNRLRALAGGDGRFGGLYDLVSISPSDARDGVYARFAVVRRARMTLRWH